jgi:predicted HD phosphohydrolase
MNELIEKLEHLYSSHGNVRYGPEPVTVSEHSMQCAALAQIRGMSDDFIVAAGLHDIGHLLVVDDGQSYTDGGDHHELIGADMLDEYLPGSVVEPVRWHVEAKRYLVTVDPAYEAGLSEGSIASLIRQGGPMSEAEAKIFSNATAFNDAVALRRLDDAAKVPDGDRMAFADFLQIVERVASRRL